MADLTDDFLHELYAHVVPALTERFQDFMHHADGEIAALVKVARSLGIDITDSELAAPDATADRITWQPVARSATLALVNWLIEHTRDEQRVLSAVTWAQEASRELDFDVFRAKTSLAEPDARIALATTAQAIASWPTLTTPAVLLSTDRYLSVWADAASGTIGALTSAEQPLIYVPIVSEPAVQPEGDDLTHVALDQPSVDFVPIGPMVDYSELDGCLVVSGAVRTQEDVLLNTGFCLNPQQEWSYIPHDDALHVSSGEPLAFSVPRTVAVHVVEGGLLIERDVSKHISLTGAVDSKPSEVVMGEPDAGHAKPIARYIHE